MSLKIKLTILYTVLMTVVVCGVFIPLFTLNQQELFSNARHHLIETVAEARTYIKYENGGLEFKQNLLELKHDIFLSVYDSDGTLLYGKIPYAFENTAPFEDGKIRVYKGMDGTRFYLLDLVYQVPDYGVVDIRGIKSVTEVEASYRDMLYRSLILFPLVVVMTAILSYFMTKRTLQPVGYITQTVRAIWEDGDLSRRISLGHGRDEIYLLAETFDMLLERVETGMKREQQFTSDVAHELRTPISTMQLQCEELLSGSQTDEQTKEKIGVLYEKVRYLSQMVSQLLMLSRADQGRANVEMERLDFSELTEMVLEEIQADAQEKGIAVHADIRSELYMKGDSMLLIRFWMNLLNNAVTYGRENGTIQVGVRMRGTEIQGEIQDDGIGISEQDLPHIWERFYQADKSRTAHGNSGLGLSMVKWIVEQHHGTIQVNSREGSGTCFYFSFPADM